MGTKASKSTVVPDHIFFMKSLESSIVQGFGYIAVPDDDGVIRDFSSSVAFLSTDEGACFLSASAARKRPIAKRSDATNFINLLHVLSNPFIRRSCFSQDGVPTHTPMGRRGSFSGNQPCVLIEDTRALDRANVEFGLDSILVYSVPFTFNSERVWDRNLANQGEA